MSWQSRASTTTCEKKLTEKLADRVFFANSRSRSHEAVSSSLDVTYAFDTLVCRINEIIAFNKSSHGQHIVHVSVGDKLNNARKVLKPLRVVLSLWLQGYRSLESCWFVRNNLCGCMEPISRGKAAFPSNKQRLLNKFRRVVGDRNTTLCLFSDEGHSGVPYAVLYTPTNNFRSHSWL